MAKIQLLNEMIQVPQKLFNPYRLLILICLKTSNEELRFYKLKHDLELSDGNLASHLKTLEYEGFIKISSNLVGKRLKTSIGITQEGQKVLEEFAEHMSSLLNVLSKTNVN